MKNCAECNQSLGTTHRARVYCAPCGSERKKASRRINTLRRAARISNYAPPAIGWRDALRLWRQQGCDICGEACASGRCLSLDHCHRTGRVRGMLCHACNSVVAAVENNAVAVAAYLEKGL